MVGSRFGRGTLNKLGESEGGKGSRLFLVFFCPLNLKKRGVDPASGALLVVIFLWLVCRANSVIRFAHRRFSVLPEKSSGGRWVGKKGEKSRKSGGKVAEKLGRGKSSRFRVGGVGVRCVVRCCGGKELPPRVGRPVSRSA